MASRTVSPVRAAGRPLIVTVFDGLITTPGPCGGNADGVAHTWTSDNPAMPLINAPIAAAAAPFTLCSAARAAPAAGVPAAAFVAVSATLTAASATAFAA